MTTGDIPLLSFCIAAVVFVGYCVMDALRIRRIKKFLEDYC